MSPDPSKRVYVVDDDSAVRKSTHFLLTACGYHAQCYGSALDFIETLASLTPGCVLLDLRMPEIDGLKLLEDEQGLLARHPVIVVTGHGDTAIAVRAMKLGAVDFIEKPFEESVLLHAIEHALSRLDGMLALVRERDAARDLTTRLTPREHDVLRGLLAGLSNKAIAFRLNLSTRTIEMHRASLMERLSARSLSDALKLALLAQIAPLDVE